MTKLNILIALALVGCSASGQHPDYARNVQRCPDICEHVSVVCDTTSYDSCINECRRQAGTDEPYNLGCAMTADSVLEMRKCGFKCRMR